MKKALVFLNSPIVTLGSLEPELIAADFQITVVDATTQDITTHDPFGPELLIVLGGPQSPYQTEKFPYLLDQITLIKKRIEQDLPTLGISMGAQLIASALGSEVVPGHEKGIAPVISWQKLKITEDGKKFGLDIFAENTARVLCWQDDYYQAPKGAKILAYCEPYGQQAFLYGKHCLSIQFHAEVTQKILFTWLNHLTDQLESAKISREQFVSSTQEYIINMQMNASTFWRRWLKTFDP